MKIISYPTVEPITLEMARKQCKVDASGSPPTHEDDDLIANYLGAAREYCEVCLGAKVAPTGVQISLVEFPSDKITLQSGPVLSVSSITYFDTNEVEQIVDPSVYTLNTNQQIAVVKLNLNQEWPDVGETDDPIKVNYVIGYSAAGDSPQTQPLPYMIKQAILLTLDHFYKNRSNTIAENIKTLPLGVKELLSGLQLKSGFA